MRMSKPTTEHWLLTRKPLLSFPQIVPLNLPKKSTILNPSTSNLSRFPCSPPWMFKSHGNHARVWPITSGSLMAVGSAPSARTITSRDARTATDARSQSVKKTSRVNPNIWPYQPVRKLPLSLPTRPIRGSIGWERTFKACQLTLRKRAVTGFASAASTTTTALGMSVTSASSVCKKASQCLRHMSTEPSFSTRESSSTEQNTAQVRCTNSNK